MLIERWASRLWFLSIIGLWGLIHSHCKVQPFWELVTKIMKWSTNCTKFCITEQSVSVRSHRCRQFKKCSAKYVSCAKCNKVAKYSDELLFWDFFESQPEKCCIVAKLRELLQNEQDDRICQICSSRIEIRSVSNSEMDSKRLLRSN